MYHKRGSLRMFSMWFVSVCAWWLSFALDMEHTHKQGFLEQSAWAYQMSGCPFLSYVGKTWMMCLAILTSSGGLGEDPTLFEAWCIGISEWSRHQWLTKCSMYHDQPTLSDQWGLSFRCNVALGLIGCFEMKDIRLKTFTCGWLFGISSID